MTVDASGAQPDTGQAGGDAGEPTGDDLLVQDASSDGGTSEGDAGEAVDWQAEADKWKALARKHEKNARENSTAARDLKRIQDKDKTELQLAQERANEAERRAAESESNHHRMMAAAMMDLPVDAIDFLGAGTEEEISERAEVLSRVINERATEIAKRTVEAMGLSWDGQNGGAPGSAPTAYGAAELSRQAGRPIESMRAGGIPSQGVAPRTQEEVFRSMLEQGSD
jgi:hypothetical protein